MVIAYEDVGLGNPQACARTVAAVTAAEKIGLPEARIPLADVVIDLALSPKSNSGITAIDAALADIRAGKSGEIPAYLRDAHYKGAAKLNHGVGYKFPHDYPSDWVKQRYLPKQLSQATYYQPKTNGKYEKALANQYQRLLKAQRES